MPDISAIEKQSKEAVAAALQADPGAGVVRAIPVMSQKISGAAIENPQPKEAIVAAVRGSMLGVLLAGQSVPDASIALFDALPNMSLMMRAGPEELMSWVMEGIADATTMAPADARDSLRSRLDEKYMGTGSIFDELCRAADAKKR